LVNQDIELNNKEYYVTLEHLTDVSNKDLGYFIFLINTTFEHEIMLGSIKTISILLTLLTLVLLILGTMLIRYREKEIFNLTNALDKKNIKLQKLFDTQLNMVVISNGNKTTLVNKAMLDFFGIDSLSEFHKHYTDISEKFTPVNEYFNLKKVPKNKNWLDALEPLSGDKRVVAMQDVDNIAHAFNVSINHLEGDKFLVSLTDISQTMLEKIDLSKKMEKDELTNTFNRKFINKNISSIIAHLEPNTYLGIAMIDIDHFKSVNDTYGHNIGDIVLKQMSNYVKSSIRSDDFLIRWGGEEFIVLIVTPSINSLFKAAEHIRVRIENSSFDTIGKITCSIGISLHKLGEDINKTIEKADKALYISKNSGRNRVTKFSEDNILESNKKYLKATLDENAIIIDFECNMLDKDGYTLEDVVRKNWFDIFLDVSDMKETMDYFRTLINGKDRKLDRHTNDIICKDGTHRLLDFDNIIFTKDGKKYISFSAKEHFEQ